MSSLKLLINLVVVSFVIFSPLSSNLDLKTRQSFVPL